MSPLPLTDSGVSEVVAQLTADIYLMVLRFRDGKYIAAVAAGTWPTGRVLCSHLFSMARVEVEEGGDPELWLGDTNFRGPWLELLKVADFLRLDIPLPHPDGEQVPA